MTAEHGERQRQRCQEHSEERAPRARDLQAEQDPGQEGRDVAERVVEPGDLVAREAEREAGERGRTSRQAELAREQVRTEPREDEPEPGRGREHSVEAGLAAEPPPDPE